MIGLALSAALPSFTYTLNFTRFAPWRLRSSSFFFFSVCSNFSYVKPSVFSPHCCFRLTNSLKTACHSASSAGAPPHPASSAAAAPGRPGGDGRRRCPEPSSIDASGSVMSRPGEGEPGRPGGRGNFGLEGAEGKPRCGEEAGGVGAAALEGSPGKLNALICG